MAAHKTKRAKVKNFGLECLDPGHFPDLESVQEFFARQGYHAMICACQEALRPERVEIPAKWLRSARKAAYWLLGDLNTLTNVAIRAKPVRAAEGGMYDEEESPQERHALLAVTVGFAGEMVGPWNDRLRDAFLRYLGPSEPKATEGREAA
jgi:hypothetical protein